MASKEKLHQNWFPIDQLTKKLPAINIGKALLVIDLQNDFLSDTASLPVPFPPGLVESIKSLVPAFRDAGSVIWIKSEFENERLVNDVRNFGEKVITNDQVELAESQDEEANSSSRNSSRARPEKKAGKAPRLRPGKSTVKGGAEVLPGNELFLSFGLEGEAPSICQKGTPGVEFLGKISHLVNNDRDYFVTKSYYSAFNKTTLLPFLRGNMITELYICGLLSNISVYATALDAAKHGLATTLFEDCIGYRDRRRHELSIQKMQEYMGVQLTSSTTFVHERKPLGQPHSSTPADSAAKLGLVPNKTRMSKSKSKKKPKKPPPATGIEAAPLKGLITIAAEQRQANGTHEKPLEATSAVGGHEIDYSTKTPDDEQMKSTLEGISRQPPRVINDAESVRTELASLSLDSLPSPTFQVLEAVSATLEEVASNPRSLLSRPAATVPMSPSSLETAMAQTILPIHGRHVSRTHIRGQSIPNLKPGDIIAEGDSRIVYDLLPADLATTAFKKLKDEVKWATMYHRGGEVPRLVAVEGEIGADGSVPIYRHPADESPVLLPFSPTVLAIRDYVQKVVKHPVNHVLIQCYRDGQDNISEHSDKTLDIVRGSSIVNVSIGAQRSMTLRTKKSGLDNGLSSTTSTNGDADLEPQLRSTQRIPMPHNSIFILGQTSNMRWLHGIRADKRPSSQKSETELAFEGSRISLTFRQIGTFLSASSDQIWGQGARSKDASNPHNVVNGDTYEAEQMIKAFGTENHSSTFDWQAEYGAGFDVLNITAATPKLFASGDRVHDARVKICLAEKGLSWSTKPPSSPPETSKPTLSAQPSPSSTLPPIPHPSLPPPKFIDHDPPRTEIEGSLAILLYLETYCVTSPLLPPMSSRPAIAAVYTCMYAADALLGSWRHARRALAEFQPSEAALWLVPERVREERMRCVAGFIGEGGLRTWENRVKGFSEKEVARREEGVVKGVGFSLADVAFWPVLDCVRREWVDWRAQEWKGLEKYWSVVGERASVSLVVQEGTGQ
ncbi:MAG: hypothetical protein M1814_005671 [Vezdaea aestivalis]|nr:MAG: hypothetical protein M1814_005671 [Vezdaea aestivalis]